VVLGKKKRTHRGKCALGGASSLVRINRAVRFVRVGEPKCREVRGATLLRVPDIARDFRYPHTDGVEVRRKLLVEIAHQRQGVDFVRLVPHDMNRDLSVPRREDRGLADDTSVLILDPAQVDCALDRGGDGVHAHVTFEVCVCIRDPLALFLPLTAVLHHHAEHDVGGVKVMGEYPRQQLNATRTAVSIQVAGLGNLTEVDDFAGAGGQGEGEGEKGRHVPHGNSLGCEASVSQRLKVETVSKVTEKNNIKIEFCQWFYTENTKKHKKNHQLQAGGFGKEKTHPPRQVRLGGCGICYAGCEAGNAMERYFSSSWR
jgi:hypothetical protein